MKLARKINALSKKNIFYKMLFENTVPFNMRLRITTQPTFFQTPTPLLFENFWIRIRIRLFFKFENPTPVQTPVTIIDPTVIYPCFYLRNDRKDYCCCRNGKVTPVPGPVFHKFLTPGPDPSPKEKRRIPLESTPLIQIRSHLWLAEVYSRDERTVKFFSPSPVLIR